MRGEIRTQYELDFPIHPARYPSIHSLLRLDSPVLEGTEGYFEVWVIVFSHYEQLYVLWLYCVLGVGDVRPGEMILESFNPRESDRVFGLFREKIRIYDLWHEFDQALFESIKIFLLQAQFDSGIHSVLPEGACTPKL